MLLQCEPLVEELSQARSLESASTQTLPPAAPLPERSDSLQAPHTPPELMHAEGAPAVDPPRMAPVAMPVCICCDLTASAPAQSSWRPSARGCIRLLVALPWYQGLCCLAGHARAVLAMLPPYVAHEIRR